MVSDLARPAGFEPTVFRVGVENVIHCTTAARNPYIIAQGRPKGKKNIGEVWAVGAWATVGFAWSWQRRCFAATVGCAWSWQNGCGAEGDDCEFKGRHGAARQGASSFMRTGARSAMDSAITPGIRRGAEGAGFGNQGMDPMGSGKNLHSPVDRGAKSGYSIW